MGGKRLVQTIFADHSGGNYAIQNPLDFVKDKYATIESVDKVKDEVCSLVSSVKALERQHKLEKRKRWRNAMKTRRR